MKKLGQLDPIIVRTAKFKRSGSLKTSTALVLVDGHHRIEAATSLGWATISAVHFRGDKNAARVYELTQNLARATNTTLERARFLAELVRRILGESRAEKLAQPGGRQPGDKGISRTARELGYTRDDIRRCSVIASMSAQAMAKAEKLELDNNESALLKIAKQKNPNEQVAMAGRLGPKKKGAKKGAKKDPRTPGDAASEKNDEATYAILQAAWDKAPKCQGAFRKATANARRKFIRTLQSIPLPGKKKDAEED
jgi:ParB-like chromosome segregation protein Spo0J